MHDFDVIVIGSGMGGMACAAVLTKLAGKRVLVLERHFKLGGLSHEFRRAPGYEWDVGLHYVGGVGEGMPERRLCDFVTDGAVRWNSTGDPYDVFIYPDLRIEVPVGEAAYLERLQSEFPREAEALQRYFRDVERAATWMGMQMARKAMPGWMSFVTGVFTPHRGKLALQTTGAYLDQHLRDPTLKAVLASQWGDYGLSPDESSFGIHSLVTHSYFDGAFYPEGGGQTIANGVTAVIEASGGRCLVRREVTGLVMEGDRVVGVRAVHRHGAVEEPEEYTAPIVVSDIGAVPTYLGLVPEHVALPFRDEIRRFRHGHSAVTVYLGLAGSPRELGVGGANHWIYTSFDHDRIRREAGTLLRGAPTHAMVSFPSAKDPAATRHTGEIMSTIDYESFATYADTEWKERPEDYERLKATIADGLLDLAERHLPGLRRLVEYTEVSTPLTMEHFTNRPFGAFYGVPAVPEKYVQEWLDIETPIEGLFLTGSDVASLGIMGAQIGGAFSAARILGARGLGQVMRQFRG